jgi:hypothetical protein
MIPVIELADYLAGKPGAIKQMAREIRDALSRIYEDWITWWTNENRDPKRQKDIAA